MEEIEMVNLGDGQLYGHKRDSSKVALEGKVRIITGFTTEYIDAGFKNGYAEGKWEYYKKNELNTFMNYKNGYLDGECGELRFNGDFKETGAYKAGKKDGVWKEYYSDNEVKQAEEFKDGDLRKRTKYYTDGSIESEKEFLNKKEHGIEKRYEWETNKLKTEKNYENGKQVGKQMQYYSSNVNDYIQISNYSKAGKMDGKYTETYAETNKMKVQGQYKEGKKVGVWKYGSKDGKITKEEKYEDGKLTETKKLEN
ncbi:hypothetical protein LJB95_02190 [Paludibacteraceae bacterium OttesenSCG-928-F17]|nr:hypothetical protein [Paludibacteraceae bacterium OttesenSCG-928-F17]